MKKTAKKKTFFSVKKDKKGIAIISVVLVAFVIIAFFILVHIVPQNYLPSFLKSETPSYASSKVTTSTTPFVYEAESMSTYSLSGGLQVIDDLDASGGKAMLFSINTTANGQVSLPNAVSQLIVTVKSDRCKGSPHVIVKIDDNQVLDKGVPASNWTDYSTAISVAAGSHTVAVTFPNDLASVSGQGCDRNLKVDKLVFE